MLGLQDGWLWEPAEGGRAEGWGWDTKPATTCEQYLVSSRWTGKRLHIVTRYISLTLPCDFCLCVCLPECGGLGGGENDEAEESPRLESLHLHEWPSLHGASLRAGGRWCQQQSSYLQIPVTPPTVSPDGLNQCQFTWLPPGRLYLGLSVSTLRVFKLFTQRKMYLFHYLWSVPRQIYNICTSLFLWKQFTVTSKRSLVKGIPFKYSSQLKLKYSPSVRLHSAFA